MTRAKVHPDPGAFPSDADLPPETLFRNQKAACCEVPDIPCEKRVELLKTIEAILKQNDKAICDAVCQDFGNRSVHETRILEISPSLMGLRYTRKRLKQWMTPQNRHVSLLFPGGENQVIPQSKGVVGIVTPWNYPLFLAISPMTSALAAGNRVMVKQAANSQTLCRLLDRLFSEAIPREYISFAPGAGAGEFSSLPFDHLVFTGSPPVGKTVMKTAARNLTPVTLELGGKSPTIIAADYPLDLAVNRIMFAKLMNAGQTCIAPDYVFVPEAQVDAFIEAAGKVARKRYKDISVADYTSIIDSRAFARLTETLADAESQGARIINLLDGPLSDEGACKISPILVTGVTDEMTIMTEEIFGPVMPVLPYSEIQEVMDYVNRRERPLALYLFSNDRELADQVIGGTRSGGVTINDCAMHVAQHDVPFGGIGNSGMGHYHGYEGFLEFSKLRPVFRQSRVAVGLTPPYGIFIRLIYQTIKRLGWIS